MFKRIIALLLCVVMLISVLASCDTKDSHNHETSESTTELPQGTTHDETKPSEETTEEPEQHIHTLASAVTEKLVDSTCTTTGSFDEVVYCSTCDEEISRTSKTIEKKAHDYSQKVTISAYLKQEATCIDSALYYYSCVCGAKGTATFLYGEANGHDYASAVTAPTCTEKGYTTHTCACGDTYTSDEVSASGHSYGDWVVTTEPTESTKGIKRRDCEDCETYETSVVAELFHDHSRWDSITLDAVAPSCTKTGLTEGKKCSGCGEILVVQEVILVVEHEYKDTIIPPNCTEKGYTTHTCDCGDTYTEEVGALGHDEVKHNAKQPTCSTIGWGEYSTCTRCDYSSYEEIPQVTDGHNVIEGYCVICNIPESSPGLTYELNSDGKSYTVIGRGSCTESDLVIGIYNNSSVTSIGDNAFNRLMETGYLTSVEISDCVISIGYQAFSGCTGLKDITILNDATEIGLSAFYNTSFYNDQANWQDEVLYIDNHLIAAQKTLSGSYIIKDGTKTIADYAFNCCGSLTSITIPDSVTAIGRYAFEFCINLKDVSLGKGVTTIEYSAFRECGKIERVFISDISNWHTISFASDDANPVAGANLYLNGELVTELVVPNTITQIGDYAFIACKSLTSVIIPSSVTSIGDSAFSYCSNLTSMTIPNGVTTIGAEVFWGCSNLTSVTIPNTVTHIGDDAFDYCINLKNVYYAGTAEDWAAISCGEHVFNTSYTTCYYYSETPPTDATCNYWHYVNGAPTQW